MAPDISKTGPRMLSAVLATALKTYPFYALIKTLSLLNPNLLVPCDDGCTFIRYWGTDILPSTEHGGTPQFMTVTNGIREVEYGKSTGYTHGQRLYTNSLLAASVFIEEHTGAAGLVKKFTGLDLFSSSAKASKNAEYIPAVCPDMDMSDKCSRPEMKEKVASEGNHLAEAVSLKAYKLFIIAWGCARALHDVLVLGEGAPESATLRLGMVAFWFQVFAVASGFLWSLGAAEVFMAKVEGQSNCSCYYEMDTLPMFGVIGTPVALYLLARGKLWKLLYSILHGDFVYHLSFSVPHKTAIQNNENDPTYDFLLQHQAGGHRGLKQAPRNFKCADYRSLTGWMSGTLQIFNLTALYFVYAFAFPSLTVRFYDVVVVGFIDDGFQSLDVGAALLLLFCFGGPSYALWGQLKRLSHQWQFLYHELFNLSRLGGAFRQSPPRVMNLWLIPTLLGTIKIWSTAFTACMSYQLGYHLWSGHEITADLAPVVGAGGFYLFVSFLNVYVPSDTPYSFMMEAIKVKGGQYLPPGGFAEVQYLNEHFPHLALSDVCEVVKLFEDEFKQFSGETELKKHWVSASPEARDAWIDFAQDKLDRVGAALDEYEEAAQRETELPKVQ